MKQFWSKRIQQLTPYTPGEQPKQRTWVKLNTNENPYPPSPLALAAMVGAVGDGLRRYPDPEATDLRQTLAEHHGLSPRPDFCGQRLGRGAGVLLSGFF